MAMLERDDTSLRPLKLDDFSGQYNLKEQLRIYINSARSRNDTIEHILLSGPPGLGKTTLASIIANEMNSRIVITSGIILKSAKDIVEILLKLKKGDILFIDEIHRLPRVLEEVLYPAMEDFKLDIFVEDYSGKRACHISLDKFTLIGATTRAGMLNAPLRDRFGITAQLELYDINELTNVVVRSASILGIPLSYDGAFEIAKRAHGTPRIANSFLKRTRDYAISKNRGLVTNEVVRQALGLLNIDEMGLGKIDIKILKILAGSKKPVGLKTIASLTGEDVRTIEEVYEPYLLRIGYISAEKNGRRITPEGLAHLGMSAGKNSESEPKSKPNPKTEEDAYRILGVPPNATVDQIKKMYRILASMWHADVNSTVDDSRMKDINWAYDFLKKKKNFT